MIGFVVITYNQASHNPGLPVGAELYDSLEDTRRGRDWERAETARVGRRERHVIAEVIEMDGEEDDG